MGPECILVAVLVLACAHGFADAADKGKFHQFFGRQDSIYVLVRDRFCGEQYEHWKTMSSPNCGDTQMAASAVLLGLLPALLGIAGSSNHELSLVGQKRPLLSLLLRLGSPAANPVKSFDFGSGLRQLLDRSTPRHLSNLPRNEGVVVALIIAAQYLGTTTVLSIQTFVASDISELGVCSFAWTNSFLPPALGLHVVIPHILAMAATACRYTLEPSMPSRHPEPLLAVLARRVELEFSLGFRLP